MAVPIRPAKADQRAQLLDAARRMLEEAGPEALQARRVTAEVGASTQAIYTLFGGMPGLFEALVADGFARFTRHVQEVPETDDPVADFFRQGWAYCGWALGHPQLYRVMFGLAGAPEASITGFPEGRAHLDIMVRSLERIQAAGRIDRVDAVVAAGQFLSATHGYVLLEIGGAFGEEDGAAVLGALAINLMVGLGDERAAAERSLRALA